MKKVFSIIMAAILAFSYCAIGASAIEKDVEITEYPVIMVAGYSSSTLYEEKDDGSLGEQYWGMDIGEVIKAVLLNIGKIGVGLGAAAFDNPQLVADTVGENMVNILGDLKCDDNGNPVNKTALAYPTAESSNSQVMYDLYGSDENQFETDIMGLVREYTDAKNTYNFNVDWRMGAEYCANALRQYIQEVKEYSHCDKVNILAVSHGGQVTGTYLSLFGSDKDINNAVMTVPALGGAGILYDILGQDVHFDELNLINFIENGMRFETDFHWLLEAQQLGILDGILNALVPYMMDIIGNWGSIWDFCPSDIYEEAKAKWLDPVKNAEIIAKSDKMHYEIIPNYSKAFAKCKNSYGMNLSIIAGTDNNMTSGYAINGDGIIHTYSSTGATCAPYGERFADGYVQINKCNGKYKVSPSMTIDASTAYLPDNTWFIEGLFHGMTFWDEYSKELMMLLTLTDEIKDVYSNPDYPQFRSSSNPMYSVYAEFDSSAPGYLSDDDTKLIIKNLSIKGYPVVITGITCDGINLDFDLDLKNRTIAAGKSAEISFSGDIPNVSAKRVSLTITYTLLGSVTPLGQRTMNFTLLNGEKVKYDSSVKALYKASNPIDKVLPSEIITYITDKGFYNFASMIFNMCYESCKPLYKLFSF